MMNKYKKQILLYLFIFFLLILAFVILGKVFGVGYIGKVGSNDPLTWKATLDELPNTILKSIIITIIIAWADIKVKKKKEKEWDDIREKNDKKKNEESS